MSEALARGGVNPSQVRDAWTQLDQLAKKYGDLALDAGLAAGGALPPPFGTAVDIVSLGKSLFTGDWGGALLDLVGLIPLFGDGAKAGKIANRLMDLRRAIDAAANGLRNAFKRTNDIAKKYWDDLIKKNREVYEKAIKDCANKKCRDQKAHLKGPQYKNTPVNNGHWTGERGDSKWVPDNGSPPIEYKNGFPDYSPHSKGDVDIPMTGSRDIDDDLALQAMRKKLDDPSWDPPADHTWHHNENGTTMQLIPKNIHATGGGAHSPHMGGAALYQGNQAEAF